MKWLRDSKLSKQLILIIIIIFVIVGTLLGVLLPQALIPVYEDNLYNYLKQPLSILREDTIRNNIATDITYLYLYENQVIVSEGFDQIIQVDDVNDILREMNEKFGKFNYKNKTYYYYTEEMNQVTKIALTNDSYINRNRAEVFYTILPIMLLAFLVVSLSLILWSGFIVLKIEKLKNKIDHIEDDDYDHTIDMKMNDEMKSLAYAVEDMRLSLKYQQDLRNQMYQNISHDFKTPLTVIKSYTEAVHDGIEDADVALDVIKEQTLKLEQKVHSLLYLNKLDYIKDYKNVDIQEVNIAEVIESCVDKFKFYRKDVKFNVDVDKNAKIYGTEELWETIIDNLFGNFTRYADKEIKITVKSNKIVFYNDGPNIDKELLEVIFVPFRKGIKGEFGLGLSIIKKTLNLIGYDISIKNEKKGVSFVITKGIKK